MRPDMEPSASSPTHHASSSKRENDEAGTGTLATSPSSAASLIARQRPAYEKLAIGPLMVFGEMITGEFPTYID